MRDSFMRQTKKIVEKMFHESCKSLIQKHPMFESALTQIVALEEDTKIKIKNRQEWANKTRLA